MQANKRTLDNIFSPSIRLVAPLFQRPYVWKRDENWQPLWEAVRDQAERRLGNDGGRPHFLGAVVLNQLGNATGALDAREIIDGQQRLTTLQILITVLRDIAEQHKIGNYPSLFHRWIENPLEDETETDLMFKVWPTNVDQERFRRTMEAKSPFGIYHGHRDPMTTAPVPSSFGSNDDPVAQRFLLLHPSFEKEEFGAAYEALSKEQRKEVDLHNGVLSSLEAIPRAYLYFYAVISSWLGDSMDAAFRERMQALYNAMKQDLVLVVIDLDEKDDAQQIFETMNALGTPLLPADLVKNLLFRLADHEGAPIKQLYTRYWQTFDDKDRRWREEVRQGRLKRPRIDLFLQHYLNLVTGKEVLIADLFYAYRHWAQSQQMSPADLLEHFRSYADIYWKFEHFPEDSREALFFERMRSLDTTTVFPLMLEVFKRHNLRGGDTAVREIMQDLESYLVRRAVCGLTPKNYNRLFRSLVQYLSEADDFSPIAIRQFLLKQKADTARWPDDNEFRKEWLERPLYKAQVQERTRMLLRALDRELHTTLTSAYKPLGTVSIEHLMPQAWKDHWAPPAGASAEDAAKLRNNLIHTIGNLTIVTKSLNPKLSNGPWSKKLPEIRKRNGLCINLNLSEAWDDAAIKTRGAELFATALVTWPYPSAVSVNTTSPVPAANALPSSPSPVPAANALPSSPVTSHTASATTSSAAAVAITQEHPVTSPAKPSRVPHAKRHPRNTRTRARR